MILQKFPLLAASHRRERSAGKRRGMILCDLLFASALALSAAIIVLEASSMLVRKSSFARNYRDDAYALSDLIEEVGSEANDGIVLGKMGWRAEILPASASDGLVPLKTVVVTGGSGKEAVSFEWTLRVKGE